MQNRERLLWESFGNQGEKFTEVHSFSDAYSRLSIAREFFLLQCRTRGANLPPQTDFHGCSLTAPVPRAAPLFRRTCVSVRLSVSSRHGWRPKSEGVPQPFLGAFSASLAAFSELVNTTDVLAARARQSSTTEGEVIHSMGFLSHGKFCVRLGTPTFRKSHIFKILDDVVNEPKEWQILRWSIAPE